MLRTIASFGAAALLSAGVAAAATGSTGDSARASLSNTTAGARPVALTIALSAELRCGRLGARSLEVTLPHAMRVPHSIRRDAVRLGGRAVRSVRTAGSSIVVVLLPARGMTCDSIVPGVVRLQFTRKARLGNPPRAGSYAFGVAAVPGRSAWHGELTVRP